MTNPLDDIQIDPPQAARHWSQFQQAIFDTLESIPDDDKGDNVLIQAVAGSGKTTTIIEGLRHVYGSSLFMAFNKSIAEDIRRKALTGDVKTLNALGHALWKQHRPRAELNARKTSDILKNLMKPDEFSEYGFNASRAVGLAKNNAFGMVNEGSVDEFVELIDSYLDVPSEHLHTVAAFSKVAFERSCLDLNTFDFDDQLYMPLHEGWTYPEYDNVFIDECQDLSPIQHLMLEEFVHEQGSRLIAVGDRHQAIYGFRGALTDSMDLLKKRFEMQELPLSVSYRCAQNIVLEAQKYSPDIQWRDGAEEGLVQNCRRDPALFSNALILCRNNAPLFRAILRHVREKSPCRVLSNFLDTFQGFIRSFKCKTTKELNIKLDKWFERETEAALRRGFKGKLAGLQDKYDTLKLLAAEFSTTEEVINLVKELALGHAGPTFATVHKAKGLEHENVHILRPDLMPSQWATTPEARQQEDNLTYVAITRAKTNLTFGERPE